MGHLIAMLNEVSLSQRGGVTVELFHNRELLLMQQTNSPVYLCIHKDVPAASRGDATNLIITETKQNKTKRGRATGM